MNLIHWADQHLDYRCTFLRTHLNMNGETEAAEIRLLRKDEESVGHMRAILIQREGKPDLRVYLDDLEPMSLNLYYFETRDGETGSLIIPFPEETDDGC